MKALLALILLIAAIALATAQDSTDVKRRIKILTDPRDDDDHTLVVRATEVSGDNVDSVVFLASSKRIPRFAVRYFSKEGDSKELIAARWRLWKIFQYTENGEAGSGFDPETDSIVSGRTVYLWDDESLSGNNIFTDWNITVNDDTANSIKSIEFCNKKGIYGSTQSVQICCTISATYDADMNLTPNGVKWSIGVQGLGWDGPIAIKTSFDTLSALNSDDANGDDNSIALGTAGEAAASAEWVKTVSIEGTSCTASADIVKSVVWSGQASSDDDSDVPEEENDVEINLTAQITYFSIIPTGNCEIDSFYWDPTLMASDAFFVQPIWALLVLLAYALF